MAGQTLKTLHITPLVKLKKEVENDEDIKVLCIICNKGFFNDTALTNHVRVEHIDAYLTGDPGTWRQDAPTPSEKEGKPKDAKAKSETDMITLKTNQLISSMAPTSLMSLASQDVSYIIMKSDDLEPAKRPKVEKPSKPPKPEKISVAKTKELQPITGPFECLQPTNTAGVEGTCHQIFFSCCEYSVHYRDEHTRRRKGLKCQVCEKPLTPGDELQAPYNCQVCGSGFMLSKQLSDHMTAAHVKLKPFQCEVCHKRFTQQGGLLQHTRMHTGDRPFPCTFCEKAFTQKSGLDQHLRIHTKVRPYRCVVCNKTFSQSVHLKQHMRTHTNVSPFQCGICQKRFKQSSHLNYHLKNHNANDMTEEQRKKYAELLAMIEQNCNQSEVVEVEIDGSQAGLIEQFDQNEQYVRTEDNEQIQEHVEQVTIDGESYILGDVAGEWTARVVS